MSFRDRSDRLEQTARELVEQIRNLSKQQKDLWQQVPYLALMADGRTGWSDKYSAAYHNGHWALDSSVQSGYYTVCVDLETGELVHAGDPRQPARNEDTLRLIFNLDELDAGRIVKGLKAGAKVPIYRGYGPEDRKKRTERINRILRESKITRVSFKRIVTLEEIYKANMAAPFLD